MGCCESHRGRSVAGPGRIRFTLSQEPTKVGGRSSSNPLSAPSCAARRCCLSGGGRPAPVGCRSNLWKLGAA
jgi:hypothetical protein